MSSSPLREPPGPGLKAPGLKPNAVSETSLYGVPIVSLVIDGRERLCLAQISNTLLKNYSYNEIHNRRVALGITCVQCTPVQLELLRRAGAMPISSRRCGMITKREAERLCKSFLGEHSPPKLPENFAFDVSHDCAWGCRGSFIPARYNSSRAKCIKCSLCSMYFSPNKFIFHSHRTPEARYLQPDAANFNSWRRHLRLTEAKAADDVSHAWEDVKAMFNGGSRKRTLPPSPMKSPAPSEPKSLRLEEEPGPPGPPRSYPVIPVPSKSFSLSLKTLAPPLFPPPYFPPYGLCPKKSEDKVSVLWPGAPGAPKELWAKDLYPAFPVWWPQGPGALPVAPGALPVAPYLSKEALEEPTRSPPLLGPEERCSSAHSSCTRTDDERSGDEGPHRKLSYVSAFRPVGRDSELPIGRLYSARTGRTSPDFISDVSGSSLRSASPEDDLDVDVDEHEDEDGGHEDRGHEDRGHEDRGHEDGGHEDRGHEEEDGGLSPQHSPDAPEEEAHTALSPHEVHEDHVHTHVHAHAHPHQSSPFGAKLRPAAAPVSTRRSPEAPEAEAQRPDAASRTAAAAAAERDLEKGTNLAEQRQQDEELQKQLVEQVELRKKLEREFQHLKENFQDQMKRELSYREEMVQQLQIVRAHDALQHFSCKMLGPRQCSGACSFKPPLLPP